MGFEREEVFGMEEWGVRDINLGGFEKPRKDEERWGFW